MLMKTYDGCVFFILVAVAAMFSTWAQKKEQAYLPLKGLLKIKYNDLGTTVLLEDAVIRLNFKDRPSDESFSTNFTVMLEVKNISKQPLYLPRQIVVYGDNAGFYDDYDMHQTELVRPQKIMKIPVTIANTGHTDFRKANYLRVFFEDSSYVRIPLFTAVHFFISDSMRALKHY